MPLKPELLLFKCFLESKKRQPTWKIIWTFFTLHATPMSALPHLSRALLGIHSLLQQLTGESAFVKNSIYGQAVKSLPFGRGILNRMLQRSEGMFNCKGEFKIPPGLFY